MRRCTNRTSARPRPTRRTICADGQDHASGGSDRSNRGSNEAGLRRCSAVAAPPGRQLGTTHIDAFNGSAFVVGGEVGYQVSLEKKGTVQQCAGATVGFAIGPKNINGTGIDFGETDIAFGVGVGVVAARTEQVDVVPTGSIAVANGAAKLKDASGNTVSNSQSFEVVALGVGFVFSHQVSIKPGVSIPFTITGASTSFTVALALNFGRAR